jgi:hypothetical protein
LSSETKQIESFLAEYGWSFRNTGPKNLVTGFHGKDRRYTMHIRLSDSIVDFTIRRLAIVDDVEEIGLRIAMLNGELKVAKLHLTDLGEAILSAQVFKSCLDYETFENILGILGYYSDQCASLLEGHEPCDTEGSVHH